MKFYKMTLDEIANKLAEEIEARRKEAEKSKHYKGVTVLPEVMPVVYFGVPWRYNDAEDADESNYMRKDANWYGFKIIPQLFDGDEVIMLTGYMGGGALNSRLLCDDEGEDDIRYDIWRMIKDTIHDNDDDIASDEIMFLEII